MSDQDSSDKEFEEILSANNMNIPGFTIDSGKSAILTLGDLYEGITNLSALQADIYYFIKESLSALYENSKAGSEIETPPNMTRKQVGYLLELFDLANRFLEEQEQD